MSTINSQPSRLTALLHTDSNPTKVTLVTSPPPSPPPHAHPRVADVQQNIDSAQARHPRSCCGRIWFQKASPPAEVLLLLRDLFKSRWWRHSYVDHTATGSCWHKNRAARGGSTYHRQGVDPLLFQACVTEESWGDLLVSFEVNAGVTWESVTAARRLRGFLNG